MMSRRKSTRPIYIDFAALYSWAVKKSNEGTTMYLTRLQDAMKSIASLFDGSLGTFTSPMDGQIYSYPVICNQSDIMDMYLDEYRYRLVAKPLYSNAFEYWEGDYNDIEWVNCLSSFCSRIERLVRFTTPSWKRILEAMAIKYNPLADYFSNEKEQGGSAPYASITNNEAGDPKISNWTLSNNGKSSYQTNTTTSDTNSGTISNFSTTYDDASSDRLASRQTSSGQNGTTYQSASDLPNNGWFRDKKVEGNDASSPQEALERELEIAQAFQDLVHKYCEDVINTEVFLSVYA